MYIASNSKTKNRTNKRNAEDGSANLGWIAVVVIVPLFTLLVMLWILVRQLRDQSNKRSRRSSTSSKSISSNLALPAPVYSGSTADTISSTTGVFGDSYDPYDPYPCANAASSTAGSDETWTCSTCGTINVTGTYTNWLPDQQTHTYCHDSIDCPRCMAQTERTKKRRRRARGDMGHDHITRFLQQQAAYDNTPEPGLGECCYSYRYVRTAEKDEYWCNRHMNQREANHVPEYAPTAWPELDGLRPVYRRENRGGNGCVDAFTFQTA